MFLHTSFNGPGGYFCSDLLSNNIWSTSTFYRIRCLRLSPGFTVFFILISYSLFLKPFFRRLGFYLSHWYHLSLSVSIIYHKVFNISISFLYKFTYDVFMQKVESLKMLSKALTHTYEICYN